MNSTPGNPATEAGTTGRTTPISGATMSGFGKIAPKWSTETPATSKTGDLTAVGSTGMTGAGPSSLSLVTISPTGSPATVAGNKRPPSGVTTSGSGKIAPKWSTEAPVTSRTGALTAAGSTGMTGTGWNSLSLATSSTPGSPATVTGSTKTQFGMHATMTKA